jgi:outer membrane protein OmpA-like peptidoglycan-associated protein
LGGVGALGLHNPNGTGTDTDRAVHFGGGLKYYFSRYALVRVDVRDVLAGKQGGGSKLNSHNLEVLGGIGLTFGRRVRKPSVTTVMVAPAAPAAAAEPDLDHDGDGIADSLDQCPNEAELLNGFEDQDGCPESDRDGDHFWDVPDQDACPNEAGVDPDGCPVRDADNDGILDAQDRCPNEPENVNGFEDEDGCRDEIPEVELKHFSGAIAGIQFETASAQITADSEPTLRQASELLKKYPTLTLEISGHTDSVGSDAKNLDLSQRRADAVRLYLVNSGVAETRLSVLAAGESQPIAENRTKTGRLLNRRIEFKIQQR